MGNVCADKYPGGNYPVGNYPGGNYPYWTYDAETIIEYINMRHGVIQPKMFTLLLYDKMSFSFRQFEFSSVSA